MFVRSPVLRKEQCVLVMSACKKLSLFSMIGDMLALSLSFVVFNHASRKGCGRSLASWRCNSITTNRSTGRHSKNAHFTHVSTSQN